MYSRRRRYWPVSKRASSKDAVQGIAVVRDALRATSNGVRQFCGLPLLLREALKMPPLFAGKTVVTN
jgi:hypothetical protein